MYTRQSTQTSGHKTTHTCMYTRPQAHIRMYTRQHTHKYAPKTAPKTVHTHIQKIGHACLCTQDSITLMYSRQCTHMYTRKHTDTFAHKTAQTHLAGFPCNGLSKFHDFSMIYTVFHDHFMSQKIKNNVF